MAQETCAWCYYWKPFPAGNGQGSCTGALPVIGFDLEEPHRAKWPETFSWESCGAWRPRDPEPEPENPSDPEPEPEKPTKQRRTPLRVVRPA